MNVSFKQMIVFMLLSGLLLVSACRKTSKPGNAEIQFNHFFKQSDFKADTTTTHILDNGEELVFSRFQYYISNIQLKNSSGDWWVQEESYHIVNARSLSPHILIEGIPEGEYTAMRFIIGVDSTRNFSGAQEGALSASNEMFWTWNTGYIFLMSEGTCEQREGDNKTFIHHIGGFQEENNAIRHREIIFNENLVIRNAASPEVLIKVHVEKLYEGDAIQLSVAETHRVHAPGETAVKLSQNYAQMFELDRVEN